MDSDQADYRVRYDKHDVAEFIKSKFAEIQAVREDGQKEYAHDDSRPFRNFEALAAKLNIPREKVALVFFQKHLDGIYAHINGHRSQRESVYGRFKDAHMYLFLIELMLREDEVNRSEEGNEGP